MYVGGSNPSQDVVEASAQIKYSSKDTLKDLSAFRGFRRVISPKVGIKVQTHSPVTLIVTDPDGFTVDADTLVVTEREHIRGIPGVLYYSTDDNLDDLVYAPELKVGVYTIQVVPKPGVPPTATFSLEAMGAAKLVELAQDVPISEIPSQPFGILSTGDEIVPVQPTLLPNAPPTLVGLGDQTLDEGTTLDVGVSATDPDGDPITLSTTGLPAFASFTDHGDGTGLLALAPGFDDAGVYPGVQVMASDGLLTDTEVITITVIDVNCPPVADADGPYAGTVGQTVTFDGSGSFDPDGTIVLYEWDFESDGTFDFSSATSPTASHTYPDAFSGVVTLRVTDDDGGVGSDTAPVDVVLPPPEPWAVEYRWGDPPPGYSFDDWPIFEGWMNVRIENRGTGDAFNVTATVTDWPINTTVPDPDVTVGDIAAGSSAWSADTFTTRVDMTIPGVDPCEGVIWRIEYDDAYGTHHVIEDVPQFPPGEGPPPCP